MVEFGVVFPVVALLIAGIVAFGMAASITVALQHAAREAARTLALSEDDPYGAAYGATPLGSRISVQPSGSCDPEEPGVGDVRVVTGFTFRIEPIPAMRLSGSAVMRCGA
jgi:Flp pilus assembly protein TadG